MSKCRNFSIYLLKQGFDENNALKDDHGLETAVARNLPKGAVLYLLDNPPKPPWWRSYFGISNNLNQATKGALIFLHANSRCFALTFGHVHHHLKDEAYEYDFGLRVTLNCIDPTLLKSTDTVEPGSSRRRRTQVPTGSDLTYFDFDRDSTIIKSLVGKVKDEYKTLFSHATGSSNIHISSNVISDELPGICEKLLTLYQSEAYKSEFPDIHNIEPVKDPKKLEQLNVELLRAFKEKRDELYLTVPDILNYREGLSVTFLGAGESLNYENLFTFQYYEYLESRGIELAHVTEEMLKAHKLNLIDENGHVKESHRIYNCIAVDIEMEGGAQTYHLCDGSWYKVTHDYVIRLQTFLDPYFEDCAMLPFIHETEGKYNRAVAATDGRFICLDGTNISPRGNTSVEPCDLYRLEDGKSVFYYVKVSTRSALLSHLFNQGVNSIELIGSEVEARTKLEQLITSGLGSNDRKAYLSPINTSNFKVVYAIVTRKEKAKRSKNLPLFSRISLMRSIRALHLMKIPAVYCFVEDRTENKPGQKKKRKCVAE